MKTAYCRSCGAQIYFIRTPAGKLTPVDAEQRLYKRNRDGRDRVITWEGDVISCDLDVEPADADGIGYNSQFRESQPDDGFSVSTMDQPDHLR